MFDLARRRTLRRGLAQGGWGYDAFPDEPLLDAGATVVIADLQGPGVVTRLHSTQPRCADLEPAWMELSPLERGALCARGVIVEVLYDGETEPSIAVPLGELFGDGALGRAMHFTTPFVEKVADAYNATLPLPYRERIVIRLRNETHLNLLNYMTAEWVALDEWDPSLYLLHAGFQRRAFQLDPDSDERFLHLQGDGFLVGQSWTVTTDDPHFARMFYVMEGNNEIRLDGAAEPTFNYLGTEDAFGFSWGFQQPFAGVYNGIPYVSLEAPTCIAAYRFRDADAIAFRRSLDLRVNWRYEMRSEVYQQRVIDLVAAPRGDGDEGGAWLPADRSAGRGWIDYAMTTFWYAADTSFKPSAPPPLDERVAEVLHPNPAGDR
jgi:Protein of unknown function (DUF2961)